MKHLAILAVFLAPFLLAEELAKAPPVLAFRLVFPAGKEGVPKLPVMGTDATVCLEPAVLMDAKSVAVAKAHRDHLGGFQIALTFTPAGTKAFADLTARNVDRRLAILVDGKVLSAPTIKDRISGGKAVIAGSFSRKQAKALADRINDAVKQAKK